MRILAVVLVLLVSGCSTQPPAPTDRDFDPIVQRRLDSVWLQSGLDAKRRPEVTAGRPASQLDAASAFSGCMVERGWPDYFVEKNGFGYRAIQLAVTDAEKLDWYECFAANPVDSQYTLASEAQFDVVYDYFQDVLIPCLAENGYPVTDAPTREEFVTTWVGWTDPLFPFVWNPYYEFPAITPPSPMTAICPPTPPDQEFYEFR